MLGLKCALLISLLFVSQGGAQDAVGFRDPDQRQSYLAHIAAANFALRLHDAADAKRWLKQAPGDHQEWEWRFLNSRADSSISNWNTGDWQAIRVEYAPSAERLLIACSDGFVRILDGAQPKIVAEWKVGKQAVYAARFSPDGKFVATCNRDGKIGVWRTENGEQLWEATDGGQGLADVAFSPDGNSLLFCSWFRDDRGVIGLVSLWSVAEGKETWRNEFGVKPIVAARFSRDGSKFAVGTWDGIIGIWNALDLQAPARQLNFSDSIAYAAIDDLAFSPSGDQLAAASKNGSPRVWDATTGTLVRELRGHDNAVFAISFAAEGRLLTAGSDGTIRLWNSVDGSAIQKWWGHESRIGSLAIRPDGTQFATSSADGTIRNWDLNIQGDFPKEQRGQYIYGLSVSLDGRYLAAGGMTDSDVYVYDLSNRELRHRIKGPDSSINYLSFGPNHQVVGGNWAGDVVIWNAETGKEVRRMKDPDGAGLNQCSFSSNGKWIAVGTSARANVIWDAQTGTLIEKIPSPNSSSVQFSPDSKQLATCSEGGNVRIYGTDDWTELAKIATPATSIRDLEYSPDGHWLAVADESGQCFLIETNAHTVKYSLDAHTQRAWSLCFSTDGKYLITGSADKNVKFWNVQSGELVMTNSDATEIVYNVVARPESEEIIVNSSGQEIFVLSPDPGSSRSLTRTQESDLATGGK